MNIFFLQPHNKKLQPPEKGCIVSFYYTFAKEKRRGWYRVVFSMMFATQMMLLTQWCRFAYEVCLTTHLHIIKTYRVTNRQIPIWIPYFYTVSSVIISY